MTTTSLLPHLEVMEVVVMEEVMEEEEDIILETRDQPMTGRYLFFL